MAQVPSLTGGQPLDDLVAAGGDRAWIGALRGHLPFLADLIPADLFIFCPRSDGALIAVAEANPTVRESFYRRSQLGAPLSPDATAVYQALQTGEIAEGPAGKVIGGQPMHQRAYPLKRGRTVCAVLVVERNLYEELKHTEEKRNLYRTAVERTVTTLLSKCKAVDLPLPPVGAGDATLILNAEGVIRHASHQSASLARRWGLAELLDGLNWSDTFPARGELREVDKNALFEEFELTGRRQAVAIRIVPLSPADSEVASIVVLRDVTELREKDRELAIKETIIREVHHRVKNNLQTIAGLLRLQARRARNQEVKEILGDCIERISSIALVHEYLAHDDVGTVDMKELAYNLLKAALQGFTSPDVQVAARLISSKERIVLPSAKATSSALVINELVQNACKHAFRGRRKGTLDLVMEQGEAGDLLLKVRDDGIGLPHGFDLESEGHLGWNIVRNLVRDDLRGTLKLESSSSGTTVTITIPSERR
jgi:two-component sensor histidine kinase